MAFIDRLNNVVVASYARRQYEGQEQIADDDIELLAFLAPKYTPLEQLEALISQGQQQMSENPLPLYVQEQIYDLEVFIRNYYTRGAFALIVQKIQGYMLPEDDLEITDIHRTSVAALKSAMLAIFQVPPQE